MMWLNCDISYPSTLGVISSGGKHHNQNRKEQHHYGAGAHFYVAPATNFYMYM
jgi:hypothetical protein